MRTRYKLVAVGMTITTGLVLSNVLPSSAQSDPDSFRKRTKVINARAAARYPKAKDPTMKALADCLSEHGAVYEEDTGLLIYKSDSDPDLKLVDACTADLAIDQPPTKR
jgi:hypothetical protein